MAWMIREDQLDPDQREFINVESKKSGNIWVKDLQEVANPFYLFIP
jgi:hypothetical protein